MSLFLSDFRKYLVLIYKLSPQALASIFALAICLTHFSRRLILVLNSKKYLCIFIAFFCLLSFQTSFAFSFDPRQLLEDQLLRIIDEEFMRVSDDPESLEWTEDYGVQPIDGYELDYSEKCAFIANSRNKKALAACVVILGSN